MKGIQESQISCSRPTFQKSEEYCSLSNLKWFLSSFSRRIWDTQKCEFELKYKAWAVEAWSNSRAENPNMQLQI